MSRQAEPAFEDFWKDRYDVLKDRGYLICPRNCPGCAKVSAVCTQTQFPGYTMDLPDPDMVNRHIPVAYTTRATRVADGQLVTVKVMNETLSDGMTKLQSHVLDMRPNNHYIRVLDMFEDIRAEYGEWHVVILPFMRPIPSSSFSRVKDVVEFVNQVLLGVIFMHRHHVAHRDPSLHNIVTNEGVDHLHNLHEETTRHASQPLSDESQQPKFYFTGMHYWTWRDPVPSARYGTWASGNCSRDLSPPEYVSPWANPGDPEEQQFYNPFFLDVFLVGIMLQKDFLETYSNVDFLRTLVGGMTHSQPRHRLSSEECLEEWYAILSTISQSALRRNLKLRPRRTWDRKIAISCAVKYIEQLWK